MRDIYLLAIFILLSQAIFAQSKPTITFIDNDTTNSL